MKRDEFWNSLHKNPLIDKNPILDDKVFQIIEDMELHKESLKETLNYAHFLNKALGGEQQYRSVVPHYIDVQFEKWGYECVEGIGVDVEKYGVKISNKSKVGFFHKDDGSFCCTKDGVKSTGKIIMANVHPGSSNKTKKKKKNNSPVYDIVCLLEHTPCLACGLVPKYKIKIVSEENSDMCPGIEFEDIQWVLPAELQIFPSPLSDIQIMRIEEEVRRIKRPLLFDELAAMKGNINS